MEYTLAHKLSLLLVMLVMIFLTAFLLQTRMAAAQEKAESSPSQIVAVSGQQA